MSVRTLSLFGLIVLGGVSAIAPTAFGAPKYSGSVSAASPVFRWSGGPLNSPNVVGEACIGLASESQCDDILIKVEDAGTLRVHWKATGTAGIAWLQGLLYEADASGGSEDSSIAGGGDAVNDYSFSRALRGPGYYLLELSPYLLALNASYDADVTLTIPEPEASAVEARPVPNKAPRITLTRFAARPDASRRLRFSGTAADDTSVARVELAIVNVRGTACRALTRAGTLVPMRSCSSPLRQLEVKGTTRWSYRLRRRLPKGRYVVAVRAIDDAGLAGRVVRRGFSVS